MTANGVRLRSGPGTSYSVIGSVAKGDRLRLTKSRGEWSKVNTSDGATGWISSSYITSSKETESAGEDSALTGGGNSSIRGKLIVVDPGHGGSDPGMIGTTFDTQEKDLTLSTSLLLAEELRARGARVILTRSRDSEKPSLSARAQVAVSSKADAFVSIHYNSSPKHTSGALVYYYSRSKDEPLARAIEGPVDKLSLGSNGVAFGNYHVLRENTRPSVLLELGFLSTEKDEREVRTARYQRNAAAAIAEGLVKYFSRQSI